MRKRSGAQWCETVCTDELTEKICDHIRNGNYVITACQAEGIARSSFYLWLKKAKQNEERDVAYGDCPYIRFAKAIERAQATGEIFLMNNVLAGKQGWQGSAWILERTKQDKFGQRQQVSVRSEVRHVLDSPPSVGSDMSAWLQRHQPKALPPRHREVQQSMEQESLLEEDSGD